MGNVVDGPRPYRVSVNGPFERLPTCEHDPGIGVAYICDKCPTIDGLVAEVCCDGLSLDPSYMRPAISALLAAGFKIEKAS